MTRPLRFLGAIYSSSSSLTPSSSLSAATVAEPPEAVAVESDFVVILAALLCALICVVGLFAVARRGASGNEYVDGDEIRLLPHCGHGFHVTCIDTWLGSHSSCPSCRQILVVARCRTCGEYPAVSCGGGGEGGRTEAELKARDEAGSSSGFLPF
ncbi:hypothetical protein U1Q18_010887 [Sarracenia purpurea var. burkii]